MRGRASPGARRPRCWPIAWSARRLRWRAREPQSWAGRGLLGVFFFHVAFGLGPGLVDLGVVLSAGLLVGDVLTLLDPAVYLVRVLAHEFLGLVDKALEVWHWRIPPVSCVTASLLTVRPPSCVGNSGHPHHALNFYYS